MATAGPNSAGSGANSGTGSAFTSPGNILTSNNGYATVTMSSAQQSQFLEATNFGFAIPAGSTIDGIVAEIERASSSVASSVSVVDVNVYIIKGGTRQTIQDKASPTLWTTTDTYAVYGGATDLWGVSWTDSDINASNFGVALKCKPSGLASRTASVDHVRITVYYTPPVGPPASASSFFAFF